MVDVEVVRAHLADSPDLSRFAAVLSPDEQARRDGYKVQESRDVFTLARGLLRLELAKRLECDPRDPEFDLRPAGKPGVRPSHPSRPDWRFSVSHTGSHIAMAFAEGVDVGIDIERVDRAVNSLEVARRYFTAAECHVLEALAHEARPRAFFAGWTRKEAIVKARGLTMAESLNTLSVDLDPGTAHPGYADAADVSPRARCRLTAFEFLDHRLIGAVAVQSGRAPRLRIQVLSGTRFD